MAFKKPTSAETMAATLNEDHGRRQEWTHYWPHLRIGAICEHQRQSAVSERLQSGLEIHHQLHQSVASSTFSAGGDSGSLIVSRSAAHPTALLFAGSSTTTIGNPIGQVLSHVSSSLGKQVSFVGNSTRTTNVSCPATAGVTSAAHGGPSQVDIDRVDALKQAHESDLMADPAVMAMGIGADERNSGGRAKPLPILARRGSSTDCAAHDSVGRGDCLLD